MNRLLLTALACLISVSVFGQGWVQQFGTPYTNHRAFDLEKSNSGYVFSYRETPWRYCITKTTQNGDEEWSFCLDHIGSGFDPYLLRKFIRWNWLCICIL